MTPIVMRPVSGAGLTTLQQLAAGVIRQTWMDARHEPAARAWFESEDFEFWCAVAGIDPELVRARVARAGTRSAARCERRLF